MPLPTRVKYQTAVQNPRICFRDPDLANSTARCSANGMPLTYSGGFATTFRMRNAGVDWAVRCFTRPVAQLERRYGIIGRYISTDKLAFLGSAALLPEGIQIDAHWQPIIKMEWLSGYTLNSYIETQLRAASKIIKLRDELVGVAKAMQAKKMAHGDLQHGNIIVFDGRPRLVDYDGIYLPDLKGMVPDELGHKHYQHPQRARGDWGPEMDRFSLIALYVGLSAIALRRELWDTFNCGENVLFTKSDFAEPAASELFDELGGIAAIEKMSKDFRALCAGPLRSVPTLQDFVARTVAVNGWEVGTKPKRAETPGESGSINLAATDRASVVANLGSEVRVHGLIAGKRDAMTKYDDPYLFLNVGAYPAAAFTFVIWSEGLEKYAALGEDPASWVGKEVQAQGTVEDFRGRLQMTIHEPVQLRVIG